MVIDREYANLNSDKYIGKGIKSVLAHGWAPREITLDPERNDAARAMLADACPIRMALRLDAGVEFLIERGVGKLRAHEVALLAS